MKTTIRILSLLLTLALSLPLFGVSAFAAEEGNYGTHDFEKLAEGAKLAGTDGFAAVPVHSTVKKETVNNQTNTYVRVPFVGGEATSNDSNWDKSIQANHASLKNATSVTFEVDYRPHYGGSGAPTLEAQFRNYGFVDSEGTTHNNGAFFNLFIINVNNGTLKNCGTIVPGAEGMKMDEWNHLKLVYDMSNGHFSIYINDALYAVQEGPKFQYFSGVWVTHYNCKDVSVDANMFIAAKCNKNDGAYTATEGANTSYVDVDNIRIYETPVMNIEVDGEKKSFEEGDVLNLSKAGKKFVYAEVKNTAGVTSIITSPELAVEKGIASITTHQLGIEMQETVDARLGSPTGLRFVTTLNAADLQAITESQNVKSVRIGTRIAPTLQLAANADASKVTFLDVAATVGKWYAEDTANGTVSFAGSIANIMEKNYNRAFSGVGYVEITLADDTKLTVYAKDDKNQYPCDTIASAATAVLKSDDDLTRGQKAAMKKFADTYQGDFETMYKNDLKGLNVLAIGDSLFTGSDTTTPQSKQWTNLLGQEFGWNLTNLGVGGASVSYKSGQGNFSMYQNLFHTPSYKYGSTDSKYFTWGTPSGDPEDVQLILLQGGSNDYGPKVAAPKGTVGSENPAEFLGAWKLMVDRLLVVYPNATVVMMTAWENNDQSARIAIDNMNAIEFTSSVKDLYAELYADNDRVYLIDSGAPAVSGVNMRDSAWRAQYSHDAFHLNATGMELMAKSMTPLIWDVVKQAGIQAATNE